MKSIWFDIKMIFNSPNQGLKKLIAFNIFIFLGLMVGKVMLILAGHEEIFSAALEHLTLSSTPIIVLKEPWTVFTYFFIHIELFHLLFNMMFLFWFGIIIQDFIGSDRIVKLFIWGGLSGAVAYLLLVNSFSYFILKGPTYLNGASAGVFAIVVAAATIKPTYRIHLFFICLFKKNFDNSTINFFSILFFNYFAWNLRRWGLVPCLLAKIHFASSYCPIYFYLYSFGAGKKRNFNIYFGSIYFTYFIKLQRTW
jgi:membrane associated rhomboid family serine protease